jgi:polysaccharide deacetylase 2 family uncharacterized protein YibQ
MLKKRSKNQVLISGVFFSVLILLATIFYVINSSIDAQEISEAQVLDKDREALYNYDPPELLSDNHLSEIRDLYNNLRAENIEVNDLDQIEKREEEKREITYEEIIPLQKEEIVPTEVTPIKREVPVVHPSEKRVEKNLPKLAIIIDDVAFPHQVERIKKSVKFTLTLSFFPVEKEHPKTREMSKEEQVYMIHLPLEAKNFHREEPNTLHVGDSRIQIEKRIDSILQDFPDLQYINNHTGSKFTSHYTSMRYLLEILKERDIKFIDSVTIGSTKAEQIGEELGIDVRRRNIFIDNKLSVGYIHKQLKKVVELAKRDGSAIAIGHPHKATIKALATAGDIFSGVELVYINEI